MTTGADWAGRVGQVWAEEWRRTERSFAGIEPALEQAVLAVAPDKGRFLDVGCGVGTTTLAVAAARPGARVTGVDLAADMIAIARQRVPDGVTVDFTAADALDYAAQAGPFDLLFSRHGVMFFSDPAAAFARLHAAAAPGARLVFSCFAAIEQNPWATLLTPAPARSASYVPGPFAFADTDVGRDLRAAGWRDPTATLVRYGYAAGAGEDPITDAVALFSRIGPAASALRDAGVAARPALLDRLAAAVAPFRNGDHVIIPAAAWIWSARA